MNGKDKQFLGYLRREVSGGAGAGTLQDWSGTFPSRWSPSSCPSLSGREDIPSPDPGGAGEGAESVPGTVLCHKAAPQ